MYIYWLGKILKKKQKQMPSIYYFRQNVNIEIKIKMEYYLWDKQCGVLNTFPTLNRTSKSKIFGLP